MERNLRQLDLVIDEYLQNDPGVENPAPYDPDPELYEEPLPQSLPGTFPAEDEREVPDQNLHDYLQDHPSLEDPEDD